MPLQKQIVPVNLNGIDTKTDPKQVVMGKLLVLQNGIFKTAKEIRKRFGFDDIPSTLTAGVNAAAYNNELTTLDGQSLYSYSVSQETQNNKGTLPTTALSTMSVVRNSFIQTQQDSAINGNIQVYSWTDSTGVKRYSVFDNATDQLLVNDITFDSSNGNSKVLALGNYIVIIYQNGTNLFYKYILKTTPTVISSAQTISATMVSGADFDAEIIGGNLYVVYDSSAGNISVVGINTSLTIFGTFNLTDTPNIMTVFGDASNNVWVVFTDSTGLNYFVLSSALTVVLAKTLITTNPANPASIYNITGVVTGSTATIYYSISPPISFTPQSTFTSYVNDVTATITGTIGTPTILVRGQGLASKAFIYNSIYYFLSSFFTIEQPTYFLINQQGIAVAKISSGLGGGPGIGILPEVNNVSSGVYQFTTLKKDNLVAFNDFPSNGVASNLFTGTGVQSSTITFTLAARPKLYLGNNLHYGGGILWMYDGTFPIEHGYNIYPEGLTGTNTTTGGAIGIGASTSTVNQVQYTAIYEWIDNQGQLHRSATAIPVTDTLPIITATTFTGNTTINTTTVSAISSLTGLVQGQVITNTNFPSGTYITAIVGAGIITVSQPATATSTGSSFTTKDTGTATIIVPTLRLTGKTNVMIVIYRTTNNGTIFYRLNNPQSPLYNNPAADTVSYTDTLADAFLIQNEQLYTTGGEVDNIAAPAISALTSYRNRAAYLTPEDPYSWGYSKQVISGSPVEFNSELFTEEVDPKGGPLSALAEMDDKLILFKNNSIFYVVGEGPTPSGLNNDYQDPQIISTDTGCLNQNSIVLTPIGLMFQSPKGIYLLSRGLAVSYIGAEVEFYNNQTVTSALLVTSLNQIRFTMNSGIMLVYDYYFQQWSVFTNLNAADSTLFQNEHVFITPTGGINQEDMTVFTDNGNFIPLFIKTSWLSLAGLQGFERIYKMLLLGNYKSAHTLNVGVSFDFNPTLYPMGPIPVLSDPGLYQYRLFMPYQKCETFQFTINDSQVSPYGEGFSISAITLEVGSKQGLNKLPAAASYG